MLSLFRILLLLILISPFLVLLVRVGGFTALQWDEVFFVGKRALWQSLLSSSLSLFFGLASVPGLLYAQKKKWSYWLEGLVLLPGFLPPLFIIISSINTLEGIQINPFGLTGIVFAHTLMNFGLVAVLIRRVIQSQSIGAIELSILEGASALRIYWRGLLPQLKAELFYIFIFVFGMSFTSFTVPMILGGVKPYTFSILLFNKIRVAGDWGQAMSLALIESFVFLVFLFLKFEKYPKVGGGSPNVFKYLAHPLMVFIPLAGGLVALLGDFAGLVDGVKYLSQQGLASSLEPALGSLFLGGTVSLFLLMAFLFLLYLAPLGWLGRFLSLFTAPSAAIIAFSFLILTPSHWGYQWEKISIGLFISLMPHLFKLYFSQPLEKLYSQVMVAQQMGASRGLIWRSLLVPQMLRPLGFVCGLGGFWAAGDFSISKIIADSNITLPLHITSLLGSYRLEQATTLVWLMLLIGFIIFIFWERLSYVLSQKFG